MFVVKAYSYFYSSGMLSLGLGLGLKAKFFGLGLGLGTLRPWPWPCFTGLGLESSGLGINHKAIRHDIMINAIAILTYLFHISCLASLFERVLCAPASSAPVERIFLQSGLIVRPNRARMSDTLLESLMFLKCNGQ